MTLEELVNKIQKLRGKSMPFHRLRDAFALIMTLDASYEDTKRQYQLDSIWTCLMNKEVNVLMARMWRSSIPGMYKDSMEALVENILVFPMDLFEPKDVFNYRKQVQIMNELQYFVYQNSHKVMNQILNNTILTVDEQMNYPSWVDGPSGRVIDGLVSEQLYELMNITGMHIYNRQWNLYWETLWPLADELEQERRVTTDRYHIDLTAQIMEQLEKLLDVQKQLLADIDDIISKGFIAHSELPILQAINKKQMRSTYTMDLIAEKAAMVCNKKSQ